MITHARMNTLLRRSAPLVVLPLLACGLTTAGCTRLQATQVSAGPEAAVKPKGICPPFHLRDEAGNVIDPVKGVNTGAPYSPRQTCGAPGCHNYETITRGYHFTQGLGEAPTAEQQARYAWATSPGNFGGNWCSPAPLYRYLSPKQNDSTARMDMSAFDFFTAPCGTCHPGGGSAEFDREGKRYDRWMADPASGFTPGADNRFDGDYRKARWTESGVLEADCLLCHLPTYDVGARQAQLGQWTFRWAATAGARLASVTGSVKDSTPVAVVYDPSRFEPDGTLRLSLTRQPRDAACLSCHAQPGWKKRGANYRSATDVHLRAGLRCVDCHPAGRSATDPRISGREEHQIAKGDDPGGLVRNDLDNTVVACADCHDTGRRGAPVARHAGLPPLHLDRIACQTCHIPERIVMPAEVQAGDVYNAFPWISLPSKKLWTFYGPDGVARNHYGFLDVMGYDDKPVEPFRPTLFRYKGKIFPGNRVHSAWPGLEIEGQQALMQPRMGDILRMWEAHRKDPGRYPRLSAIVDDTGDGVPEVNRPEEIDALIVSVRQALEDVGYPLERTRVVWVQNDRVYRSGSDFHTVPKHEWEASPFANVHKYSHDIYPARAALGAQGCRDCHARTSPFFFQAVLLDPFTPEGNGIRTSQSRVLGYNGGPPHYRGLAGLTASFFTWLTVVVMSLLVGHLLLDAFARSRRRTSYRASGPTVEVQRFNNHVRAQHLLLMLSVVGLGVSGVFMFGTRYPGAAWAVALSGALGGLDFWRMVHRIGGALLVATAGYHLVYSLIHEEGRRDFRQMLPSASDFTHLWQNLRYFTGRASNGPRFARFTYFEKFDYWAVFWGCAIMIGTGGAMWFSDVTRLVLPGVTQEAFDAFKEAHAHEAVLALLAIAIWHVYNIHFRPGRFPGSWIWIHGRMSREEMAREHAADPSLEA